MGTRAIIEIKINGERLTRLFFPNDGYVSGVGKELYNVSKRKHVNGYSCPDLEYNRISGFVSLLIASSVKNKTESKARVNEMFGNPPPIDLCTGGCEIIFDNDQNFDYIDYTYIVNFNEDIEYPKPPTIKVLSIGESTKCMSVSEFGKFIEIDGFKDE